MKKMSVLSMIAFVAIILTSCGGGVKESNGVEEEFNGVEEEFNMNNNSTNISGDLEESSSSESSSSSYSSTSDDEDDEEVVAKKSGNTNWDKVLADYEAYTDKYIKLLKKANAGDMSAMTEYVEMLEKAQEFQESLENADDDLTSAQMQKFTKIQMKLANAAAGL